MTSESIDRDYRHLQRFLGSLSFRLRLLALFDFALLLASAILLLLLGSLFAYGLKGRFIYLPFVYSAATFVSIGALTLIGAWRIFRRTPFSRVARGLEKQFPSLRDDVTSSLELFGEAAGPGEGERLSRGLIAAQLRKTIREMDAIRVKEVVSLREALCRFRLFVPLLATCAVVMVVDPQFPNRALALITHPASFAPAEHLVISVDPQKAVLLRGTGLIIRATVTGILPGAPMLTVWPDQGAPSRFPMEPEGKGRFKFEVFHGSSSFRFQVSGGRSASPLGSVLVVDPPELARLKLTLVPPGYSHLPDSVKEDGHIEALKGSLVSVEARTVAPVREAKIVLEGLSEVSMEVTGLRLKGSLLVMDPSAYSISLKDEAGFENKNPARYQIRIIPDKEPRGEILSPAQDMEISGDEVVPIVYSATDDFGVTAVRLAYQMGGSERYISLKTRNDGRSVGPETFRWDLSSLALNAGERITYRLEVEDNDTVSGPKKGVSPSFVLSVRDSRERAGKEGEETRVLAERLLDLLAEQLEGTREKESLAESLQDLVKQVDRSLERTKNPVERLDFEALKRNMASLAGRVREEPTERVTQELERLALLAEDMTKRARMNEVEAMAREIRNRQRRLTDTLKDLQGPLTREALEAAMKELQKLEELLRSVMEALGKLATRLPEEFINSQDLNGLDAQDMFSDLNEIQRKLMAGDIAGALEAAQKLLQTLSEMMASLGRAGREAGASGSDKLGGEMSRQAGELDKILAEQREILNDTERIERDMKDLVEEEVGKRIEQYLPLYRSELERLRHLLPSEQGDLVKDLETMLQEGRLRRFVDLLEEMDKMLAGSPDLQKLLSELKEMMDRLTPAPDELKGKLDRERFPGLAERQEGVRERARAFHEKLEMLAQLFPGMDTEILNNIKEAKGSMADAAGRLKKEDAPGAVPPEQEALRRLAQSQQGMQQMAQQMSTRMQALMQGYPLAYDPRPGWYYGPWAPMPTLPQPELNLPRQKGYTGIDQEEFDPPSQDAYRTPAALREKITEALKEGTPSQYKKDVEKYFRGLTQ